MKYGTGILALAALLAGCGGGGGGSDGPDMNACDAIGLQPRIINGTSCSGTSAIIRLQIDGSSCSGTLISPTKVVTASHCVTVDADFETEVDPAVVTVSRGSDTDVVARGKNIFLSPALGPDFAALAAAAPDFDPSDPNAVDQLVTLILEKGLSDIAVVELDRIVPLPSMAVEIHTASAEGDILSVFGFGATVSPAVEASPVLVSGEMEVDVVGPKNIGATFGDDGSDVCKGDSGGPAIQIRNAVPAITGIVSLGTKDCQPGERDVFTATAGAGIGDFLRSVAPEATYL